MAERRMFTMKIIDSDAFLDMPLSAQSLYFHLNMRADDDGFINNPKKITRMIGASEDDFKLLIAKRFILTFDTGVIVIKHWRMHNLLRKDRYNETQYVDEKRQLVLKDNGAYTELEHVIPCQQITEKPTDNQMATTWQPTDNQMATQDSIGKYSIDKDSIGVVVNNKYIQGEAPQPQIADYGAIAADWNSIPHTVNIDSIIPCTRREDELRTCISIFGSDGIRNAINKVRTSEYLKSKGNVVFDRFINRNVIQGLLEGAYDKVYKQNKKDNTDTAFNNFHQRSYDFSKLEEKLFE